MFIKSLQINDIDGIVRLIPFHPGMNLIIDETSSESSKLTGNNVGKTTLLMLVDFCLGSDGKSIYTDPETKKGEYTLVKDYLINKEVLITLILSENLNDPISNQLVIERNFLSRKRCIRRINGKQLTLDEFEECLVEYLIPGHYGKKPTYSQIISNNIRYKDISVSNTLKTLNSFTRDDEYETLHLFLLGCDFHKGALKQDLLAQIRSEQTFKARLESKQTRSAYDTSLALLIDEINTLDNRKNKFYNSKSIEHDIEDLNQAKFEIKFTSSRLNKNKLRYNLILDAVKDIESGKMDIDTNELRKLYGETLEKIGNIPRSFEDLLSFHNRMVEEKARYISKELPELTLKIEEDTISVSSLMMKEKGLVSRINESVSIGELEELIIELNEKYRKKGEFEAIIEQISNTETSLDELNKSLNSIDDELFSNEFEAQIQTQINKFNKYFSAVSLELYGEKYAMKFDKKTTKSGQRVYKFSTFNTNFSSGKKQGEIVCFDLAYILFSNNENIPSYNFLLNDKKELMHDNQLIEISRFVEAHKDKVQYIASILKDKLPTELNNDKFFIIKLSQQDKLFRIESS